MDETETIVQAVKEGLTGSRSLIEDAQAEPLEGQQAFPGFEPPKKKPLSANAVLKNMNKVSFRMEYLKSPEDALIAWDAPADELQTYLDTHFETLVKQTAKATGGDPEQIRDKNRRTPEQQQKMIEISAAYTVARFDAFFESLFYSALKILEPLPGIYDNRSAIEDHAQNDIVDPATYYPPVKEQAAVYFFAIHFDEFKPEAAGELSENQAEELREIFQKLDAFFADQESNKRTKTTEPARILSKFVHQEHPPQPSKIAQAESIGAFTSIGERLFIPTDSEYMDAFTTSTRANIGFFHKDPKNGTRRLATDVNPAFLQALAKTVLLHIYSGKKGDISVYFPSFARELGIDLKRLKEEDSAQEAQEANTEETAISQRAKERNVFIDQKLAEWDNDWGVLPRDMTEYKIMAMHTYNPETEIFTFQSPYLEQLFSSLIAKEEKELDGGKHYHLWSSDLLHASAASDRNPAAVEMATRILQGVQQRGLKPDAKLKQNRGRAFADETEITFSITCSGLIKDCPQIREKLKELPDANRRTKLLKRAFPAMYKILETKSDLFRYYKDLTITEVIPTAKTLGSVITITHHGGDPKYQKPILPLPDDTEEPEDQTQAAPENAE